jgi:hypothetical protein
VLGLKEKRSAQLKFPYILSPSTGVTGEPQDLTYPMVTKSLALLKPNLAKPLEDLAVFWLAQSGPSLLEPFLILYSLLTLGGYTGSITPDRVIFFNS